MINSIKILGIDYSVSLSDSLVEEHGASGLCHPDLSKIEISTHSSSQVQKTTLLHEVVEAVCSHLDIDIKHHYIELLEIGLFQVLRDNPEFVEFIMENANAHEGAL